MPRAINPLTIRQRLAITQEEMADLLGVSFASVNRWEGGHSSPMGPARELYEALDGALRAGHSAEAILKAAAKQRGEFLYILFRMAYGPRARRAG